MILCFSPSVPLRLTNAGSHIDSIKLTASGFLRIVNPAPQTVGTVVSCLDHIGGESKDLIGDVCTGHPCGTVDPSEKTRVGHSLAAQQRSRLLP